MNEGAKTAIFAGVALLFGCVWLLARPKEQELQTNELVGEVLFPKFTDAGEAASLEIVRYNEELGELHPFKVAKNGKTGLWSIPSHSDYPADAEQRIRDVATSLVGLKVLGVVTNDASEHELFGVLEPNKDSTKLGDKGIGMLVRFEDQKGKELANLVLGKPVKGSDGHRFARQPGQNIVYDIAIDPERFSTKFEDWIQKDLLSLNAFDVEAAQVKDYSVLRTPQGFAIEPRFEAKCKWDSAANKWQLDEFLTYRKAEGPEALKPIPSALLEGEEINSDKLNEMKNALGDLDIVDVRRKPAGLGSDLKAEASFLNDQESVNSLVNRGFYPLSVSGGEPEILSANGELHVSMKDGYDYVLRFGNVAGTEEGNESKLNRYLFVTARFNEGKFPQPALEEVPQKPTTADVPPPPTEENQQKKEADAAAPPAEASADDPKNEKTPEETALDKEIQRIEKENKRKLDEWHENRDKAQAKVRELNARFADWYYVVAEDVYKKIRLGRSDLVKEGAKAADEGFGVDAFRKLESEGLKKKTAE